MRWRTSRQLARELQDAGLRAWLFDLTSLTQRVRNTCAGKFSVRVEQQGWGRPRLEEYHALGLQSGRQALIREVDLLCDEYPWCLRARSFR